MRSITLHYFLSFLLLSNLAHAVTLLHELTAPFPQQDTYFGRSVAGAGDVNRDGYDDLVVGAYMFDLEGGLANAGMAFVFSGLTGDTLYSLTSLFPETDGKFGYAVAGAGDVNNDGYDDILIGAPFEDPVIGISNGGRVYVFHGLTGDPILTVTSPNAQPSGQFGRAVAGIGDVNADFHADLLIGASYESPGTSPSNAGRVYIVSGATGDTLLTLRSMNEESGGRFGWSVAGLMDISGDGLPDLVVGAPWEDPGSSEIDAGRAYVFNGATGSCLYTLHGWNHPDEEFGYAVAGAGDTNRDHFEDILVGAPRWDNPYAGSTESGFVRRFSGASGLTLPIDYELFEGDFAWAGASVAGIGDVDRDGYSDFAYGAPGYWYPSNPGRGGVEILCGATGYILDYYIQSPHPQNYGSFGVAISYAGDVNNDWLPDIIIGAPFENPARAYVFEFDHPNMTLNGIIAEGSLHLSWDPVPGTIEYWIFGAPNDHYFEPDMCPPFHNRLGVSYTTTISYPAGIGDPSINWTYLVVAVNDLNLPLCASNRVGAFDKAAMIP